MPPPLTLPFLNLLDEVPWLEGWTPTEQLPKGRRAMIPGCCFMPYSLWPQARNDSMSVGIVGVQPVKFNDCIMLTDWEALEGLRQAEIKPEPAPIPTWTPRLGDEVRVSGHWFDGITGIIKRLDALYAHLDVKGMTSRLTVRRSLLSPI
jgi:hypothetical protein